jgi:hypothetical protein
MPTLIDLSSAKDGSGAAKIAMAAADMAMAPRLARRVRFSFVDLFLFIVVFPVVLNEANLGHPHPFK